MPRWRVLLRRLRFALLAVVSTCVILLGVLAGLTQLVMPWLASHPQHVEHWLSTRLQRPVTIGHLSGAWVNGGPLLTLDDVHIAGRAPEEPALAIPHVELVFDLYALFRRDGALSEFRLSDMNLKLVNDAANGWRLLGLDLGAPAQSESSFSMGALGALEIDRLHLTIQDPQRGLDMTLTAPVVRVLNYGEITRVLGRVRIADAPSEPLELIADLNPDTRSGELYLGARDIDLAQMTQQWMFGGIQFVAGHGTVQFWARVNAARADDVRVRVDAQEVRLTSAQPVAVDAATSVVPRVGFDRLAFVARWLREADGWTLDLADVVAGAEPPAGVAAAHAARISIERRGEEDAPVYRAAATDLALEPWGSLAMLSHKLPDGARRWLYLAHPHGTLARGDLRWSSGEDFDVSAALRGIELAPAGFAPRIARLDLDLLGDAQALLLQLPQQAVTVDLPRVFRKPFVFSQFDGDIVARRVDDAWSLETDRIGFEGEGFGGEVCGRVDIVPDRRPFVDLYALATHGEVTAAKLFWPFHVMPPPAMAWLDRALVDGRLVGGRAAFRGDLTDWPFHNHAGYFVARGEVADATLDYHPQWPRAEKLHAFAAFINDGMQVQADAAESMDNNVTQASASIADFGSLILDLAVKGEGNGATLLDFLRATPIGKHYEEPLKPLAVTGKGTLGFTLNLPIKHIETLQLNGSVDLADAKLDHSAYDLHFTDATGKLRFNQQGFAADALDVKFRNGGAKLSIAIGGYVTDARHILEATLGGRYPAATVFADVPVLLPMLTKFPGVAPWTAGVNVDQPVNGTARGHLALDSDLRGIAIDLPAPLDKRADSMLPFHLDLDLPAAGQTFVARLGDVASLKGVVPSASRAFGARIDLGTNKPGEPPASGVTIGGHAPLLDAGGWFDLIGQDSGGAGSAPIQRVDMRIDDFTLAYRHFTDMHLVIDNNAAATTFTLDSSALAGALRIPKAALAAQGITATLDRIHWPDAPADATQADTLTNFDPTALPPLHLSVRDFQLGKANFGSAEFVSHPIAGGMHVDKLESQSPNVVMQASGDWTGSAKNNRSRFGIQMSAQNLGHMMDALGFPGLIDGGATTAMIDASWPGPPSAFALAKLDGDLAIKVDEGRILDVEPGAGRIFGLFSLTEIPRRLTLDFSDFFKSGFTFNSINGKFHFSDGNAYTDDLTIKGPAADIAISGRTGFRTRDYDQRMDVNPRAGTTLPVVGAIAGGPVGAGVGLVMQGILNKPLGKAIARRYAVTGSWDKPKITPVTREKPKTNRSGQAGAAPSSHGAIDTRGVSH
ncbi:MAG: TIGR02099 family protein [Rhodanobacter sp.]|jgi:uncharacterized protein (TIGR02099 family)|nr:TIGR02099 family protein [Rhodanobacter sp.]